MGGTFLFLWTVLFLELVSAQCPASWSLEGSDHKQCMICVGATVPADRRTWRGALDYCNGNGGTLTGLHNTEQDAFVRTCVASVTAGSEYAYIGLLRPSEGGAGDDEVWTDGKAVNFGKTAIQDFETDEDCFVMYKPTTTTYMYGDLACTDVLPFVCSREPYTCLLPDEPQHATVVKVVTGPTGFAYSGNTLTYTCARGYETTDALVRTCRTDGTWNTPAPGCQPKVCPILATPANGVVQVPSDRTYKAEACYSCNDGYKLNGNEIRTCTEIGSGTWDGADPTCTLSQSDDTASTDNTTTTTTTTTTTSSTVEENLPFIIGGSLAGGVVIGVAAAMIMAASRNAAAAAAAIPRGIPSGPPAPRFPFVRPGGPRPIRPFRPY